MERLLEGIQAYEKVRLLKAEYPEEVDVLLQPFRTTSMSADVDVEQMVGTATDRLNQLARKKK